ncbi:MAG: hypothetical protein ACREVZ_07480, partial [Burkholderiales bacterium]
AREIRKAAEAAQGVQVTTTKTPTTASWSGAAQWVASTILTGGRQLFWPVGGVVNEIGRC